MEAASGLTDLVAECPLHKAAAVLAESSEHGLRWGHSRRHPRGLTAPDPGKHGHPMSSLLLPFPLLYLAYVLLWVTLDVQ